MKFSPLLRSIEIIIILLASTLLVGCDALTREPVAKRPATNEYHGVKVVDGFQWLEKGSDPAVRAWSAEQNQRARSFLDRLPARPPIEDRLRQLLTETSANYFSLKWRRGLLFLL